MKNLFKRIAILALLLVSYEASCQYQIQINNTALCGSTITFTVYDAGGNVLMNGAASPGQLNMCKGAGTAVPSYVVFTEPTGCSFTLNVTTTPSVPCSGSCMCGCISTLNFESLLISTGSTSPPCATAGNPLYQFNIS